MAEQNVQQGVEVEEERTPFEIKLEKPVPFSSIASTMFLTSNDLCLLANELFKSVFADCEGSVFEVGNGGFPFMSIVFNHGEYGDAITACERVGGEKGSDVVSRIRYRDRFISNGDRYYLTEDGKDVFKNLLQYRMYNNGNPNWKNIVSEFQENTMMYGQQPQYTKVMYLDLSRICGLIFGDEIDGDQVVYNVTLGGSLNMNYAPQVASSNYMLQVSRVSAKEVKAIYEKLGFGTGSSIIR